jgi:hypothetical protein
MLAPSQEKTKRRDKIHAREFVNAEDRVIGARARSSSYWFRRLIRPQMLIGWWTDNIEYELQELYQKLERGERPKLAIMAAPQQGKSWAATDFAAWCAGRNPDRKIIFARSQIR